MKLYIPALLIVPLIAGTSLAQTAPDCSGPDAWMIDACKKVAITAKPRLNLERKAPEFDSNSDTFGWGSTISASKDESEDERSERLDQFWEAGAIWNDPDKANIEKALVYMPPSTSQPIMRVVYKDQSQKERVLSYAERKLWTEAKKENSSLSFLDLTYTLSNPPSRPEDPYPSFRRFPTNGVTQKPDSGPDNAARARLEEKLEIPDEHRGKSGPQCTEQRDPDGSYSKNCSQTWSWSSSSGD